MEGILNTVWTELTALHPAEIAAVVFGIFYIILAARENVWGWFWGILSCTIWAWATWTLYDLLADAILNIFYVIMGFVGIYQWKNGAESSKDRPITTLPLSTHGILLLVGVVIGLLFGYFFDEYTQAASTYLDAITTVFAIIATFLLVNKVLENWIYWIVIDIVYVYLYVSRDANLFALLMVIYTIVAILALKEWRKSHSNTQTTTN